MADVDACWIGLSMALDGDAMTHEMFENRAFRDGGAYGEHRAYGAKGLIRCRSSSVITRSGRRTSTRTWATGPGSTRRRPARRRRHRGLSRESVPELGAPRAALPTRTLVRPLYTGAATRIPSKGALDVGSM